MTAPIFFTDRLILRPLMPEDAYAIQHQKGDERVSAWAARFTPLSARYKQKTGSRPRKAIALAQAINLAV